MCAALRLLQLLPDTQNAALHSRHGSTNHRPYMDTEGITVGPIPNLLGGFADFLRQLSHSIPLSVRQRLSGLFRVESSSPEHSSGRVLGSHRLE